MWNSLLCCYSSRNITQSWKWGPTPTQPELDSLELLCKIIFSVSDYFISTLSLSWVGVHYCCQNKQWDYLWCDIFCLHWYQCDAKSFIFIAYLLDRLQWSNLPECIRYSIIMHLHIKKTCNFVWLSIRNSKPCFKCSGVACESGNLNRKSEIHCSNFSQQHVNMFSSVETLC